MSPQPSWPAKADGDPGALTFASGDADSDPRIGQYVTRESWLLAAPKASPLTLPHRVESVIDDEPVTRCGRRLRKREGTTFRYEATPARRICQGCSGG